MIVDLLNGTIFFTEADPVIDHFLELAIAATNWIDQGEADAKIGEDCDFEMGIEDGPGRAALRIDKEGIVF